MKNWFFKMVLYCAGALGIAVITVFVMYRLAMIIAVVVSLIILGMLIGPPIFFIIKRKYVAAIREESKRFERG
jgi:DMSO reductase anchor subunit